MYRLIYGLELQGFSHVHSTQNFPFLEYSTPTLPPYVCLVFYLPVKLIFYSPSTLFACTDWENVPTVLRGACLSTRHDKHDTCTIIMIIKSITKEYHEWGREGKGREGMEHENV